MTLHEWLAKEKAQLEEGMGRMASYETEWHEGGLNVIDDLLYALDHNEIQE